MTKQIRAEKSVICPSGDRSDAFSSFDDLAQSAVDRGRAASVAAVRSMPSALWSEILFEWYTQRQVGCIFAANLARDPEASNWQTSYIRRDDWTAEAVTELVDRFANDEPAEALQIIFPGDGSDRQIIDILIRLCSTDRWECREIGWKGDERSDRLLVGLRWLPNSHGYKSWVLGIAPCESMPFTRRFVRAPFVALVLRPTQPIEERIPVEHRKEPVRDDLPPAHLAHMDDRLSDNRRKRLGGWEASQIKKRELLQPGPFSPARAKVTFALSESARQALVGTLIPLLQDG